MWNIVLSTLYLLGITSRDPTNPTIVATQPSSWYQWSDVTVTFTNIPEGPKEGDWVGMFLSSWPATYVKYQSLDNTSQSVLFSLLNTRDSYVAKYYRKEVVLAESDPIYPEGAYPTQPHLTVVASDVSSVRLTWTSNRTDPSYPRVLWYGEKENNLENISIAYSKTYNRSEIMKCLGYDNIPLKNDTWDHVHKHTLGCLDYGCSDDTTAVHLYFSPGYIHHAVMGPLKPSTTYYYRFGELGGLVSEIFSFVSPPPVGTVEDFSVLYTADVGLGPRQAGEDGSAIHNSVNYAGGISNVDAILQSNPNDRLWIINGDLSYANGWMWIWERWMNLIAPLATRMPVAITMGNHEVDYVNDTVGWAADDSGGECGIPTSRRFPGSEDFYTFNYGPIHFVMLNTEHNYTAQRDLVIQDLESLDRQVTPWVIVNMHRPMYGSYTSSPSQKKIFIDMFAQIFATYKVDVVFGAHKHYYERMKPMKNVTYIIDGMGGRNDIIPDNTAPSKKTAFVEFGSIGYTRIHVQQKGSVLTIQRLHAADGSTADTVSLSK